MIDRPSFGTSLDRSGLLATVMEGPADSETGEPTLDVGGGCGVGRGGVDEPGESGGEVRGRLAGLPSQAFGGSGELIPADDRNDPVGGDRLVGAVADSRPNPRLRAGLGQAGGRCLVLLVALHCRG